MCLTRIFGQPETFTNDDGSVHYHRWEMYRTPSGECWYLHRFLSGDGREDPHDHPKEFASIGLWGGYVEEYYVGNEVRRSSMRVKQWRAPWVRKFPTTHTHRIASIGSNALRHWWRPGGECWTIVITSKHKCPWGFYIKDDDPNEPYIWLPHHQYRKIRELENAA